MGTTYACLSKLVNIMIELEKQNAFRPISNHNVIFLFHFPAVFKQPITIKATEASNSELYGYIASGILMIVFLVMLLLDVPMVLRHLGMAKRNITSFKYRKM